MSADEVVLAAHYWKSNAELIADCAKLRYLDASWRVLDPTYERGTWWKVFRPVGLVTHNRDEDGVDFRALPHDDDSFDAAAYDPTYVCPGGRETTGIPEFFERYGMEDCPETPAELQEHNNAGLAEMARVVRPRDYARGYAGGYVLTKCADYVWSGDFVPGVFDTIKAARSLGFELVDVMHHLGHPRAQPERVKRPERCDRCKKRSKWAAAANGNDRNLWECQGCGALQLGPPVTQQHSRRNLSTLLVLRTPRRPKPAGLF